MNKSYTLNPPDPAGYRFESFDLPPLSCRLWPRQWKSRNRCVKKAIVPLRTQLVR